MAFNIRDTRIVKGMLSRGDRQHDIAAYFGVNGGRVAEVELPGLVCADYAGKGSKNGNSAKKSHVFLRPTCMWIGSLNGDAEASAKVGAVPKGLAPLPRQTNLRNTHNFEVYR